MPRVLFETYILLHFRIRYFPIAMLLIDDRFLIEEFLFEKYKIKFDIICLEPLLLENQYLYKI